MTRPNIYAYLCVRNEQDRYLVDVLRHLEKVVDGIAIFDDQSTDDTILVARPYGRTKVRPVNCPSFEDNEGLFRQHAWWWLREAFSPSTDDWVLAIDADEFVIAEPGHDPRDALEQFAAHHPNSAGTFNVPEVFGWDEDGTPMVRMDGKWGHIKATRFCRWNHYSFDIVTTRGGGSLPTAAARPSYRLAYLNLLHFGYADLVDQQARYERYHAAAGAHSVRHIDSIIGPRTLRRWQGATPELHRP